MGDSLTHALLAGIGLMVASDVWGYPTAAAFFAAVFVGLLCLGVFKLMMLNAEIFGRSSHET